MICPECLTEADEKLPWRASSLTQAIPGPAKTWAPKNKLQDTQETGKTHVNKYKDEGLRVQGHEITFWKRTCNKVYND